MHSAWIVPSSANFSAITYLVKLRWIDVEILYNKEICHLQLKKCRFTRLSSKFYYKSGQWSADFITVVRVHEPSSCPTDYTFCFSCRFLNGCFHRLYLIWARSNLIATNGTLVSPLKQKTTKLQNTKVGMQTTCVTCQKFDSFVW